MEIKKMKSGGFFQMPLHYPRYTKKDYQNMPEWQLDRLLAEYGLPVDGDLASKREFAIGAFLWPDDSSNIYDQKTSTNPCPFPGSCVSDSSVCCKKFKIVEFLYRVMRHA